MNKLDKTKAALVATELQRDATQTNYCIGLKVNVSPITVKRMRNQAETAGKIQAHAPRSRVKWPLKDRAPIYAELVRDHLQTNEAIARKLDVNIHQVEWERRNAMRQGSLPETSWRERRVERAWAKPLNEAEKIELIERELIRDHLQSAREISIKARTRTGLVEEARQRLAAAGKIPRLSHKELRLAREQATANARITEIKQLLASAHNTAQIGEQLGLSQKAVLRFMHIHDMEIPAWAVRGERRSLSATHVIEQTVNALQATVHGLLLIREQEITMPREHAATLLEEAKAAMKSINWMMDVLKETSHG